MHTHFKLLKIWFLAAFSCLFCLYVFLISQCEQWTYKQWKETEYRCHAHWCLRPEIKCIWYCGFVTTLAFHCTGNFCFSLNNTNNLIDTSTIREIAFKKCHSRKMVRHQAKNRVHCALVYCILNLSVAQWYSLSASRRRRRRYYLRRLNKKI